MMAHPLPVFLVGQQADGTMLAYRIEGAEVEFDRDHVLSWSMGPLAVGPVRITVSGVMAEGRAWKPGDDMPFTDSELSDTQKAVEA